MLTEPVIFYNSQSREFYSKWKLNTESRMRKKMQLKIYIRKLRYLEEKNFINI